MRVETTIFFTVLLGLKTIEAGQLELKHEALSKEQQEEFLLALALIDKDDDGKITDAELKHVLDNLQIEINDDEVREMIKEADTDGNGHLSVPELMKRLYGDAWKEIQDNVDEVFPFADKNGDKKITLEEFKNFMKTLFPKLSEETVQKMLELADSSNDGTISREEFCHVLLRYRQPPEDADAEDFHQSGHMLKRFFGWVRGIFSPLAKIAQKLKNCFVAIEK
ncbi:calmodulin-A-like isoform X1 [Macrosteles quadrilineatus]|uniref:calmodulin-A-like isoform X1 n=1 Tax=Macrosteles quadrilineatus TaxID=74068 RepID=UPI0023E20C65|nr:calmodulin-A-like isoform X1 [Macrosteles quadrilineatus]